MAAAKSASTSFGIAIDSPNLRDVGALRALLARHGAAPTKRLGQHFLVGPAVVEAILAAVGEPRFALEVGPGPGILTQPLSARCSVVAVEYDPCMVRVLAESAPDAKVVAGDALRVDLSALLIDMPTPRALVSNMPYQITGPLLERFCALRDVTDVQVLMMQREVGEKILAPPGDRARGSVSVDLQACFEIVPIAKAPPGAFWPPPKVESMVLRLTPRRDTHFPKTWRAVLRAGFAQPRKTLANNLAAGLRIKRDQAVAWLDALDLRADVRPQVLTVDQWRSLAELWATCPSRADS